MKNWNLSLTCIRYLLGVLLATYSLAVLSQDPIPNHLECGGKGSIPERIKDCENYDSRFIGKFPQVIGVIQRNVNGRRFPLYYHRSHLGIQIWAWPDKYYSLTEAKKFCNSLAEGGLSTSLKEFMLGDLEGKLKGFKFRLPGIDELSEILPLLNANYQYINRDVYQREYYEDANTYTLHKFWTHNKQVDENDFGRNVSVPWIVTTLGSLIPSGRGEQARARCVWSNRRKLADDFDY